MPVRVNAPPTGRQPAKKIGIRAGVELLSGSDTNRLAGKESGTEEGKMQDNRKNAPQTGRTFTDTVHLPPDRLNALIGVLTRREVEARILAPMIEALGARFDRDGVLEVVRETVVSIARQQGRELQHQMGGNSLIHFAGSLTAWTQNGALELDILEQTENAFSFNVTRCRYAEMYRQLGIPELGDILSCSRDFALVEGFNPRIRLERTRTIMQGAPYCDFRYRC
jgi:hypothetical protein